MRTILQGSKPSTGSLKFNADGLAIDKPRAVGIGGVLRDDFEAVKIVFC